MRQPLLINRPLYSQLVGLAITSFFADFLDPAYVAGPDLATPRPRVAPCCARTVEGGPGALAARKRRRPRRETWVWSSIGRCGLGAELRDQLCPAVEDRQDYVLL